MKTKFESIGIWKHSEEDTYDHGCNGKSDLSAYIEKNLATDSAPEIVAKFANWLGMKPEDAELDVCEEAGRVEFQRMEDGEGYEASEQQLKDWKRGELKLYAATYTIYVERVTRESVTLSTPTEA